MIRELRKVDINKVAEIWLDTNIKTHYFISAQYWKSNFELVKELLLQATVYVYEDKQEIQGFIGLSNEYIEGIFVSEEMQSQGIGKLLLDDIKTRKTRLSLNVYQKNIRAISFYQREGFEIQCEGVDEVTGEKEYVMQIAQTIKEQLIGLTPMPVLMSWGISEFAATIFKELPALRIKVNGLLHAGYVIIALNGSDYYEIYLLKDKDVECVNEEVCFNELGDVIDRAIECGTDKEEYEKICHQQLTKLLSGQFS